MNKILAAILAVLVLTTIGNAFMARNAITGAMEENGVFYINGTEMHVLPPDFGRVVNCTVGTPLNASFNITAEAIKHLGFPGKKPVVGDVP